MSDYCYRQEFRQRLSELRIHQGISARDMSLSLGLSEGYINKVENGKMLPTMSTFFEICDYLDITPQEFFDYQEASPLEIHIAVEEMNKMNPEQRDRLIRIMKDINQNR